VPRVGGRPRAVQGSLLLHRLDDRDEERRKASDNVSELRLLNVRFVLIAEGIPLFDLVFVLIEFWCEREGDTSRWQLRAASFECRSHSFSQRFPIKFKSCGKAVQVVEVMRLFAMPSFTMASSFSETTVSRG
jgi:hypothetical protein